MDEDSLGSSWVEAVAEDIRQRWRDRLTMMMMIMIIRTQVMDYCKVSGSIQTFSFG